MEAERRAAETPEETGEAEDGEADDEGSTGNRFGIPEHLLERSRTARERLGA